ncbi:MAG: hypothetical protein U0166_04180 [Acidobacteriota bacterium]
MNTKKALLMLLVLFPAWFPSRAQEDRGADSNASGTGSDEISKVDSSDAANRTWTAPKKTYYDSYYKVLLKNGTELKATAPFKVQNGRAVFHVLDNWREGPLASIPIDDIDLPATEKANKPKPKPTEPPRPIASSTSIPVFDTREMGALAESAEMKAERERIRKLREQQMEQEYKDYLAAQKPEDKKPEVSDGARSTAVSPAHLMLAKDRKVQKGMNGLAVVLSWGDPDKKEPVPENATQERWTYLVKGREPYFLTFESDMLVQIQNGERLLYTASLDEVVPPKDDK